MELLFEEAVNLFIRDRKLKNLSEKTIIYYGDKFSKLKSLLNHMGYNTKPVSITKEVIGDLIIHMKDNQELKVITINTYLRGWKAFFNFLADEEHIGRSPFKKIKLLKQTKTIIRTLSDSQIGDLLEKTGSGSYVAIRDRTILMLLLETGVRISELTNIELTDIDWENQSIRILGKGDKERLVYFQNKTKNQLKLYLNWRGTTYTKILFISTTTDAPMKPREIQNRLHEYGKRAGITNVRVSPHTLRHSMARLCVENGINIFSLQALLGHTTTNQVKHYVNLFSDTIRREHAKASPFENLQLEE